MACNVWNDKGKWGLALGSQAQSSMINIICLCYSTRMCWREEGEKGAAVAGPKMGQLTLSMGPAREEVRSYVQRATILSKRVACKLNTCKYHACKKRN
jgi:hypothetical protein